MKAASKSYRSIVNVRCMYRHRATVADILICYENTSAPCRGAKTR